MNLVKWARSRNVERQNQASPWPSISLDQALYQFGQFGYGGLGYGPGLIQTIQQKQETIQADFTGFIQGAYKQSGPIFACMLVRMLLFSEARFQFRQMNNGRPGKLFGTKDLKLLEKPWPNATTGDLLTRAISDADLAGNFYCTRVPDRQLGQKLARLRPDWVTIIKGSVEDKTVSAFDPTAELVGYIYTPGGPGSGIKPHFFLPEEVAHFAPVIDPMATYRGMSWVQPVLNEVLGDRAMTTHKIMYFEQGAAQPLDSLLATPTGWTRMGDVELGDQVMGADGHPTTVLGVYPQGEKDVYRVTFTGGVSVECCGDHLWQVQKYAQRTGGSNGRSLLGHSVRSVYSLLDEGVRYPSGPHKFAIPLTEPVEYDDPGPLPLDPYVLGALLGDGHACRYVSLATHRDDEGWMTREFMRHLPGQLLKAVPKYRAGSNSVEVRFSRRPGTPRGNWLLRRLHQLRLADVIHYEKFVPDAYMRASVGDRVALLQGLVDTDGHIQGAGVRFTSTSKRLASQLQELVEGLGGVASIGKRNRKHPKALPQWVVHFGRLPPGIVPVRLPRKREQYRLSQRVVDRTRYLKSIEYVGRKPVQCIKVAAPDGLYLTEHFIVTHNSPSLVVSMDTGRMDRKTFQEWIEMFENEHSGALNAYKTLYLGQGATAQVVGSNMRDLDYHAVIGQGETRIAAAAGVPPIIAGFSEGLESGTYSNYGQACRRFADGTLRPLWRNFCGSMETLINVPGGAQLWYDDRDIPFLQEDEKDEADVMLTKATAMRLLVDAGYDPDSITQAIEQNDFSLLDHSGLYSVQLHPPGQQDQQQPQLPQNANGGNSTNLNAGNVASAGRRDEIIANVHNVQELAKALLTAKAGK